MLEVEGRLTPREAEVIGAALHLAADGPLFPDWEFQTLFGIERAEVRTVATDWPSVDLSDDVVQCAVLGSLNLLIGYPHGHDELMGKTLGADAKYLHQLFGRTAVAMGRRHPPDDFVSRLAGNF